MTYIENYENVLSPDHTLASVFIPSRLEIARNQTRSILQTTAYCESRGLLELQKEQIEDFGKDEMAKHLEQTEKQNKIACLSSSTTLEDFSGQHSVDQNCDETLVQSWQPDPHHFFMKFFQCGAGKQAFYKIENMNTGPDDFVLIGPWPVVPVSNSARRMNAPMLSVNRIFTVLNTVYLVEAPKWETFNTSQILIYSLSHVFGVSWGFQLTLSRWLYLKF